MDLVMPKLGGVEAMRALRERVPGTRVIVLTSFIDDEHLLPAMRAGAAGYLLKNVQPQELARAIRAADAGEALIDPAVAARLVEALAEAEPDDGYERLTPREREVLALIGRGFSNKRIALELGVAEKTAKTHVSNLLGKLGLADRTQAALYASRIGQRSSGPIPDSTSPRPLVRWRDARCNRHGSFTWTRSGTRTRARRPRLARRRRRAGKERAGASVGGYLGRRPGGR